MLFWLPRGHLSTRFGSQEGTLARVFQQLSPVSKASKQIQMYFYSRHCIIINRNWLCTYCFCLYLCRSLVDADPQTGRLRGNVTLSSAAARVRMIWCFHTGRRGTTVCPLAALIQTYWLRDTLLHPLYSWMLNARPPVHAVISIMFLSSGFFACPSLCSSNLSFSLWQTSIKRIMIGYTQAKWLWTLCCCISLSQCKVNFPSWRFKLCTQGLFEKHTGLYSAVLIVQRLCIRAATGLPVARWWRSSSTWTGPRCWWAASAPSWCAATDEAAASRAPTCCTASRRSWECTRSRTRRTLSSTSHIHHGFFNIINAGFTVDLFFTVLLKHHWYLFRHTSMLGRV